MFGLLWMIAGIVMFAITIFVHKHSSYYKRNVEYLTIKRWQYWLLLILFLIPIVNIITFGLGFGAYLVALLNDDVYFIYNGKWWTKFVKFLNKEV